MVDSPPVEGSAPARSREEKQIKESQEKTFPSLIEAEQTLLAFCVVANRVREPRVQAAG